MSSSSTCRTARVYAVLDRDNTVRYVGYTILQIEERLSIHLKNAKSGRRSKFYSWLRSIDFIPSVILIEETTEDHVDEAERRWIAHYRVVSPKLTNLSPGGKGHLGYKQSQETIARRVEKLVGRQVTDETRALISQANTGRRRTEEARAKMSARKKDRPWTEAQWASHYTRFPKKDPEIIEDPRVCELCSKGPYKGVRGMYRHLERAHGIKQNGGTYT